MRWFFLFYLFLKENDNRVRLSFRFGASLGLGLELGTWNCTGNSYIIAFLRRKHKICAWKLISNIWWCKVCHGMTKCQPPWSSVCCSANSCDFPHPSLPGQWPLLGLTGQPCTLQQASPSSGLDSKPYPVQCPVQSLPQGGGCLQNFVCHYSAL